MKSIFFKRSVSFSSALLIVLASMLPILARQSQALAYGQISSREIRMSTSATSATSTKYKVIFTPSSAAGTTVKGIVVDFCSNSPILGDTCSGTVGTDVPNLTGSPTISINCTSSAPNSAPACGGMSGTWTPGTLNSNRTLTIVNTSGNNFISSTPIVFEITNVTNPSTVATFYARVYTFVNDTGGNDPTAYTPTNLGSNVPTDAGGIALSSAAQINVSSKVQERLTFCVYTTGAGNNCSGKSGTSVLLGDTNSVLDFNGAYVDKTTKMSVETNATNNVTVRMKGATLTSGSNTITALTSAATSVAGTPQFGVCLYQSAGAGLTPDALYDGTGGGGTGCSSTTQSAGTGTPGGDGGSSFALDTTQTSTTYGDDLAVKTAGTFSTATMAMLGNISAVTPAGIYTTTLTFIATGNY